MAKEESVFRSLELIESRISEKLTVENIAQGVYFSKHHYQRLFREIVGESVMEYVTKRKLTLAGRALLETGAAIIDIAMDYGYESREGFARSFKAYMGVTPTEYRRYGLAAIKQNTVKGRISMTYSKTTDEIIRELNGFIVQARETAEEARKCELPWYKEFWGSIADRTDEFADRLRDMMERISAIGERPDEITNRFIIAKAMDDVFFITHVMAFHTRLTVARAKPEDCQAMQPLCERYRGLATAGGLKIKKVYQFLTELSALIFEDIRKTAGRKMAETAQKAKDAAGIIVGYNYIKIEINHMANALADMSAGDVTVRMLEDYLFRLQIISLEADTDALRSGGMDKAMFEGIENLKESLNEAIGFYQTLPKFEEEKPFEVTVGRTLENVAYQGNILLFCTRGEIEKLTGARLNDRSLLIDEQKASFELILGNIQEFIQIALKPGDGAAFRQIGDIVYVIKEKMAEQAALLKEHGGATKLISDEFGVFYDKVMECAAAFEGHK